jgi:outer membrane protein assembly factor BamE (lipoprotein component of BamABCDE complex)
MPFSPLLLKISTPLAPHGRSVIDRCRAAEPDRTGEGRDAIFAPQHQWCTIDPPSVPVQLVTEEPAMRPMLRSGLLIAALTVFAGCTASKHLDDVRNDEGTKLTVGTVQKEIRMGMSAAEVAEVLGSPNIVTTDENRQETWIYDKISTEVAYSKSSGTVVGLIFGGSGGGLGAASRNAGATASSQKTLTVIIKFDDNKQVRDFSYRQSSF